MKRPMYQSPQRALVTFDWCVVSRGSRARYDIGISATPPFFRQLALLNLVKRKMAAISERIVMRNSVQIKSYLNWATPTPKIQLITVVERKYVWPCRWPIAGKARWSKTTFPVWALSCVILLGSRQLWWKCVGPWLSASGLISSYTRVIAYWPLNEVFCDRSFQSVM